jgi:hypothetical protein
MRKIIRQLIKESYYDKFKNRDFTIPGSRKVVLSNFRGILSLLTSNPESVNTAVEIMRMIEPYSLKDAEIRNIADNYLHVRLEFHNPDVATSIHLGIKKHPECNIGLDPRIELFSAPGTGIVNYSLLLPRKKR